jgi:2-polyprenyl-3-methyl-5-hydroxy-6-metoxy-1,4-benzoquinol methylase
MQHWTDVTSDPNSKTARQLRQAQLAATWRPSIEGRLSYFEEVCRDATVLNLGCVDQVPEGYQIAPLHRRLSAVAARCVGIDINVPGVASLRAEGFEVVQGDVTDPELPSTLPCSFDVVIAGEIIEHVVNVGGLHANAWTLLKPDGRLFISLPNPYLLATAVGETLGWFSGNADHVAEYRPYGMIELAARTQFELTSWRGEANPKFWEGKRRPLGLLARCVSALRPQSVADCGSIVDEFSRVSG